MFNLVVPFLFCKTNSEELKKYESSVSYPFKFFNDLTAEKTIKIFSLLNLDNAELGQVLIGLDEVDKKLFSDFKNENSFSVIFGSKIPCVEEDVFFRRYKNELIFILKEGKADSLEGFVKKYFPEILDYTDTLISSNALEILNEEEFTQEDAIEFMKVSNLSIEELIHEIEDANITIRDSYDDLFEYIYIEDVDSSGFAHSKLLQKPFSPDIIKYENIRHYIVEKDPRVTKLSSGKYVLNYNVFVEDYN